MVKPVAAMEVQRVEVLVRTVGAAAAMLAEIVAEVVLAVDEAVVSMVARLAERWVVPMVAPVEVQEVVLRAVG